MSWLALLLLGCALADLSNRRAAPRGVPAVVGALAVLVVGFLAGMGAGRLLVLGAIAAVVVAWSLSASAAFDKGLSWLPLLILGGGVALALAASGAAPAVAGVLAQWWSGIAWPVGQSVSADRALLVSSMLLVQLSTANVLVRLVLAATGTFNPARRAFEAAATPTDPAHELKGGRLLGPMERLLIVGLGLTGNLTAASIVVAAKGLLRFPELNSRRDQTHLHRLTEYFLVGSFVSWMLALGSLALIAQ